MKKQAWNWVNAIVLTIVAGTIANGGFSLLQGENLERGDWGWFIVGQVCLIVIGIKKLWDVSRHGRNDAEAPGLAVGQGPRQEGTD